MAPTAAATKKRRVDDAETRRRIGLASPPKFKVPKPEPPPVLVKPKKNIREADDFMETVRTKRQIADDRAREEREALEQGLEGMDISEIRKLVRVEGMIIERTTAPPQVVPRADESERWEDKWNGRKNFKKFRRRGGENEPIRRNIIVKVAEAMPRDFGIGEKYWLDGGNERESQNKRKKGKGKETQEICQPEPRSSGRATRKVVSEASEDNVVLSDSEVGIIGNPSTAKSQSVSQRTAKSKSQSQTLVDKTNETQSVPASSAGTKRAAATASTKPAPAKRAKRVVARVESDNDDSDDDGLAFKFRRK